MDTLHHILTTYWGQTVLLLAFISYFGKRVFDLKSKRKEINHSLFQQRKLDAVNMFFSKYSETELMWKNLVIYEILENKFSASELDSVIFSKLNELRKSELELQIYFKEMEYKWFTDLVEGMWSINEVLQRVYFNHEQEENKVLRAVAFQSQLKDVMKRNKPILNEMTSNIRSSFG